MDADPRVAGFLGRVLDSHGAPVGTCFEVRPGVLVTAWHVLDDLGAGEVGTVVRVDPLRGGSDTDARVLALDPVHDLAVLRAVEPLLESVPGLGSSDDMVLEGRVAVTGAPSLADESVADDYAYRFADASGRWAGGTTRDGVPLARLRSPDVLPGMSGAPVLTLADGVPAEGAGLVVGVVSARYNSVDGWFRDTVWVARIENLLPLLAGIAEVTVQSRRGRGPIDVSFVVDAQRVRLTGPGVDVGESHPGVSARLADAMRGLSRARASVGGARDTATDPAASGVSATPGQVGALLAEAFLPERVAEAWAQLLDRAQRSHAPLRVGMELDESVRGLPWEALVLPDGRPLALHPLSVAYRRSPGAAPVPEEPGPLRIVVAISSPLTGGGGVLDYERELRNILVAVRGARQSRAQVRIVHFATTAQIRAELRREPVHVLHLSGHGRPGLLELEGDDGAARQVSAPEFVDEAVPAGRMPAVIVLAACHTDAATAAGDPSFAASLLAHGAPAVIATETAVTDIYAPRMFARLYEALVDSESSDVIEALAEARRTVQQQLIESTDPRDRQLAGCQEWAVVTVLAAAPSVALFDPAAPDRPTVAGVRSGSGRAVPAGLLSRDVGEFVGRRRAQRRWPAQLLAAGSAGMVVHGIGGIGKTTLAAELLRRIGEFDPDQHIVVAASGLLGGRVTVDSLLAALGRALWLPLRTHPDVELVQVCEIAQSPDIDWEQRWQLLRDRVLTSVPVVLVLDNFEDNLTDPVTPDVDPDTTAAAADESETDSGSDAVGGRRAP